MNSRKYHNRLRAALHQPVTVLAMSLLFVIVLGPANPAGASGQHVAINHQDMTVCSLQCVAPSRKDGKETITTTVKESKSKPEREPCADCIVNYVKKGNYPGPLIPDIVRADKIPIFLQVSAFLS